jgi:hypothetical protein
MRFSVSYELPFGKGRQFLGSGVLSQIIGNWTLASNAAYASGRPQGIATGVTLPIGGGADLPFITSYTNWRASYSGTFNPFGNLWWDKNAFNQQPASVLNTLMGNSTVVNPKARLPWSLNEDVNVARTFPIRENLRLTFRVEAFNILNRHVWGAATNTLNSAAFGQVRSQSDNPRQVQLVAKIYF